MALILILEDGTGRADSNTYASVAEADAYHDAHLYADAWTAASTAQKEKALAMATRTINANVVWRGYRKGQDQALDWPRYYAKRDDIDAFASVGMGQRLGGYWPEYEVPRPVKDATAEFARLLLALDRTAEDETKGIKRLSLGGGAVEIEFDPNDRRDVLPAEVSRMLAMLAKTRGGRVVRNVTRR